MHYPGVVQRAALPTGTEGTFYGTWNTPGFAESILSRFCAAATLSLGSS